MRKVEHLLTFGEAASEVFCAKFDPSDKYLACGYADGMTRIYNIATQKLSFTLQGAITDDMPITALAWRPQSQ
jgi:WD40 repeat protein